MMTENDAEKSAADRGGITGDWRDVDGESDARYVRVLWDSTILQCRETRGAADRRCYKRCYMYVQPFALVQHNLHNL